jgi:hypothetical protein
MLNVPGLISSPREQYVTQPRISYHGRGGRRFCYLLRVACVFTTFLSFVSLGRQTAMKHIGKIALAAVLFFIEVNLPGVSQGTRQFREGKGNDTAFGCANSGCWTSSRHSQLWATYWQRRTLAESKQHITRHVSRLPLDRQSAQQRVDRNLLKYVALVLPPHIVKRHVSLAASHRTLRLSFTSDSRSTERRSLTTAPSIFAQLSRSSP